MKKLLKSLTLFGIGGITYYLIELLWRGHSHPSMIIVGGFCFVIIGSMNEDFLWEDSLLSQGVLGSIVVTSIELLAGAYLNIHLGLDIWDYSNMPFNFMGQICLPFALLWVVLSMAAVVLDDWLRYWLFNEEKPHYRLFKGECR